MSGDAADLFITTDAVGGVWSYSVALARGAAAAGARCVLAVLGPAPRPEQRLAAAGIEGCRLIETGLPLDWTVTSREALDAIVPVLIAHARDAGCTAAHLHAPALANALWHIPVVAVAHSCMATWWDAVHGGPPPHHLAWHRQATSEGMAATDAVVAPSHAFAAALRRLYRPECAIHVVHNGLPPSVLPCAPRDTAVLSAGRLWDPGKNIAVLDAAAAILGSPVHVAGPDEGPDGGRMHVAHLSHVGNLPQSALRDLMARCAIFAAPSLYEPFGLAVLEAAQQACALVLSDIPTFRELWSGAAVFVEPGSPAAWASALAALANDRSPAYDLGQAAAERSRRYTQNTMVAQTLALHHGPRQRARRAA